MLIPLVCGLSSASAEESLFSSSKFVGERRTFWNVGTSVVLGECFTDWEAAATLRQQAGMVSSVLSVENWYEIDEEVDVEEDC